LKSASLGATLPFQKGKNNPEKVKWFIMEVKQAMLI
jgi:hypothetical protein